MEELTYMGLLMKAQKGVPMTEFEANSFELEQGLRLKRFRSFDFGKIEQYVNAGNSEGAALKEQNARFARKCPSNKGGYVNPGFGGCLIRRDDCVPTPIANIPDMILPPPGWEGRKSIERMLENFRFRLKQVSETGVLPD